MEDSIFVVDNIASDDEDENEPTEQSTYNSTSTKIKGQLFTFMCFRNITCHISACYESRSFEEVLISPDI